MELDEKTGRVIGGAQFAGSFGPGRYYAYTCVDFKGDGYDIVTRLVFAGLQTV